MYAVDSYKVIRISRAKFHCNRLTTVQDIQDYACLIFGTHRMLMYRVGQHPVYAWLQSRLVACVDYKNVLESETAQQGVSGMKVPSSSSGGIPMRKLVTKSPENEN